MGYCMEKTGGKFNIAQHNVIHVFNTIKQLMGQASNGRGGKFSWVYTDVVLRADNLQEQMEEWRWPVKTDAYGNVIGISFTGEKLGDDIKLFKAIAPFVVAGSFIDMLGEDGEQWRYYFDGQTCKELTPTVQYDIPHDNVIDVEAREVPERRALR